MPFCRKCGRYLPQYSLCCPECKTSTTAPIIKIKKGSSTPQVSKDVIPVESANTMQTKTDNAVKASVIKPVKVVILSKAFDVAKESKTILTAENITPTKPIIQTNLSTSEVTHEIKQSNTSTEEDIITNPHDYERQAFVFDLKCLSGHYWRAGKALPVSNGKAYCPKCGEQLRKPDRKGKKQYRTVGS